MRDLVLTPPADTEDGDDPAAESPDAARMRVALRRLAADPAGAREVERRVRLMQRMQADRAARVRAEGEVEQVSMEVGR